jgi:hypothetical protein
VTQAPLKPSEASEETQQDIAEKRAAIERIMRRRFDRAIAAGELPDNASSTNLARFYSVVVQGIALRAQHGGTTEELRHVVDVAMNSWPAKTPVWSVWQDFAVERAASEVGGSHKFTVPKSSQSG